MGFKPYLKDQLASFSALTLLERSFELSEGDVRLPKLFRQTVPQHWPGGGKTVVIAVK